MPLFADVLRVGHETREPVLQAGLPPSADGSRTTASDATSLSGPGIEGVLVALGLPPRRPEVGVRAYAGQSGRDSRRDPVGPSAAEAV